MSSCKKTLRHHRDGQTASSTSLLAILNTLADQMTHLCDDLPAFSKERRTQVLRNQDIQGLLLAPIHQAAGGMDSGGLATATS